MVREEVNGNLVDGISRRITHRSAHALRLTIFYTRDCSKNNIWARVVYDGDNIVIFRFTRETNRRRRKTSKTIFKKIKKNTFVQIYIYLYALYYIYI